MYVRMQTKPPESKDSICYLATQAVRKILAYYNRSLKPLGLTAQQVMALNVLWREDGLSLGVFAKRAGMCKAAAVTMIKRLESMGLVTKKINPEDARLNVLTECSGIGGRIGRNIHCAYRESRGFPLRVIRGIGLWVINQDTKERKGGIGYGKKANSRSWLGLG